MRRKVLIPLSVRYKNPMFYIHGMIRALMFVFLSTFFPDAYGQEPIKIALVCPNGIADLSREQQSAIDFLNERGQYALTLMDAKTISRQAGVLFDYKLVWWHTDTIKGYTNDDISGLKKNLTDYINKGGNLLLTLDALKLVHTLGFESIKPETKMKPAKDEGYGRKLGIHAFREHPLFDGLNGGSYILAPTNDTTVTLTGYFGDAVPKQGKVVAVDWDYIFIRENAKLVIEYNYGKGKILAIGAYMNLDIKNLNRVHLEKMLENAINYLAGRMENKKKYYWDYAPQTVSVITDTLYNKTLSASSSIWETETDSITIIRPEATSNYWDVAGKRMLVMGNEKGGIDEIWAHPFMAVKDFNTRVQFIGNDSLLLLNDLNPEIQVRPDCFTRIYHFGKAILKEIITVSPDKPVMLVHYEYSGSSPLLLYISYQSNIRLMWPYSEYVLKNINIRYINDIHSYSITDGSGDFCITGGSSKKPLIHLAGQFSGYHISSGFSGKPLNVESTVSGIPGEQFEGSVAFGYYLEPKDIIDFVISATNEGYETTVKSFYTALNNPDLVYQEAKAHADAIRSNSLTISTPDPDFNIGYQWALLATDRFMVNTPGVGESLVAGYSTTKTGWDGGHKINGRPGYGWYFGRDAQWSGMAMLGYGDTYNVKKILEMFVKYQDLNGKILHELSTSGFVHYDAADATPLFVILAGRYLSHTGDTVFIRQNWNAITQALNYCFSTDTDHDNLIENTNVGHGWVEGGSLYGTHTTLYLASCWAEALKQASDMAVALNMTDKSAFYNTQSELVKAIINNDFWNASKRYYYDGKYRDGSYLDEPTVMPAIPLLFGQSQAEKSRPVLEEFASNQFSSDWGCRIVKENSKHFNPTGYHEGSVWPLFTGWVSLAEYKNGNPVQGYMHLMNNLIVYHNWGLGFIEEVLNGEEYKPSGVCRHQCWSETMVLQPAIEGMLGFKPDATYNRLSLSPAFPADWKHVDVANLKVGDKNIRFNFKQTENKLLYIFNKTGGNDACVVRFEPVLNPGSVVESVWVDGQQLAGDYSKGMVINFELKKTSSIEINLTRGVSVIPKVQYPEPGQTSKGERLIRQSFNNNKLDMTFESLNNTTSRFELFTGDYRLLSVAGGSIMVTGENKVELRVTFEGNEGKYCQKDVQIVFEKK